MIEQVNGTTFRCKIGEDYSEIGNLDASRFEPHIMLPRWSGECKFKLLFPSVQIAAPVIAGDKERLQYRIGDIGLDWYSLAPNKQHDGALEQEITLFSRPPSNELRFPYEADGLSLFHQPKLTQEEIDEGDFRPDNIVNSIAIHHATKSGHEIDKTNYMAGIAFHLFRGQAVDSNGWKVWEEKFVDLGRHEIISVVPYDFWLNARYPVRSTSETFGYTTAGGTATSKGDDFIGGNVHPGAVGTATSMHWYGKNSGDPVQLGLYRVSDSVLMDNTAGVALGAGAAWVSDAINVVVAAVDYCLAWNTDGGTTSWYYNSVSSHGYWYKSENYGTWPNPFDGTKATSSRWYSIYVTYTPPAAGGPAGVKTLEDLAIASVKTINDTAIASVKTINDSAA